jgi:hypothetical protein
MAKLDGLIQGQDVVFDTHQAGDSQALHVEDLHLEKRLHDGGGKIRFPLFGNRQPSHSGRMSSGTHDSVVREVTKTLRKNQALTERLAQTVVEQLRRFSNGEATVKNAEAAARKLASYFGLGKSFVNSVARFAETRLVHFVSQHAGPTPGSLVEIVQSKARIEVRRARSVYSAKLWRKRGPGAR